MPLNAVIMAGGEGTRLRPLTCDTPKPMVPLLGKPVLSYSLQLLRRHQLTEVGVSLLYLPERITRAFGAGAQEGVRLHYAREKEPIGTAGSVKLAASGKLTPTEPFVVLSGDGLTDCDLTAALQFHHEKRALATLVLARVREPLAYGVVVTDADGRVLRFVEKPGWGEVYADTVNTGVYVLSPEALAMIPEKGACDFGQDLFPRMVREGKPVYAFVSDGYWCDVGDEAAYIRAQADLLNGRVALETGPLIAETAQVHPTALLEGPVYLGAGTVIGPHAILSGGCAVGAGAKVGAHARLERSVLWEDARAGDWARLRGAVLCRAATAGAGAEMHEDSALGNGAALGARAVLETGAKVWPGKWVDPCVRVHGCLVWGGASRPEIRDGRTRASRPEDACVLAAAWHAALSADRIALCHDGSTEGAALYQAAAGALSAQGAGTLLLSAAALPVLRTVQTLEHAAGGMRFAQGGAVLLTAEGGCTPARSLERKAESLAARQDYTAPFSHGAGKTVLLPDAEALYVGALSALIPSLRKESALRLRVYAAEESHAALARRVLTAAAIPCTVCLLPQPEDDRLPPVEPQETGFVLSPTLESVQVFDMHGMPDDARQTLLAYAALPPEEKTWLCRLDAPAALDALAAQRGAALTRMGGSAAQWDAALLQAGSRQFRLQRDGLYVLLRLCAVLRETPLRALLETLPTLSRRVERVPAALSERGKTLRALAEETEGAALDGGLRLPLCGGWVTVSADSAEPEMVVCGEAANYETADEICGEIVKRLKKILG